MISLNVAFAGYSYRYPRCGLMLALVVAVGGNWIVEQAHSSLLFRHSRMMWLCQRLKVCSLVLHGGQWGCCRETVTYLYLHAC